ncbi:helix-turn-helix domain-containing protein [Algivirga pacifica]|uniref:Helix-turn-helix domain-containing protein n=1 Tax=Algivirga pacifica TaxID=1162670 RepID=A0ABP9DME2_9BACT
MSTNEINLITEAVTQSLKQQLDLYNVIHKEVMGVEDVAIYLGVSLPTVYRYISTGELPHFKKPGVRKVYFRRTEIDQHFLSKSNRVPCSMELKQMAKMAILKHKY